MVLVVSVPLLCFNQTLLCAGHELLSSQNIAQIFMSNRVEDLCVNVACFKRPVVALWRSMCISKSLLKIGRDRPSDRQTDWHHMRTDRKMMVQSEMQMSKLLAAILAIRHQSAAAAPWAAVL